MFVYDGGMDIFYVHDITSANVKNKEIASYISKNKIDTSDISSDVVSHIIENPDKSTEVIFIQCYKYSGEGKVLQDQKYLVSVIGEKYTHYVEDKNGKFVYSIPSANEYDFKQCGFKQRRFTQEAYFSERESSKRVDELYTRGETVYGNSHKFVNEFCYNLYEEYLEQLDFKGRLFDMASLRSKSNCYEMPLFMNSTFIESEFVFFGRAEEITIIDDSSVSDFFYAHKTLSFDIETVLIDEHSKKIMDKIIQISVIFQEGESIKRCIGITIGNVIQDSNYYNFDEILRFFSNVEMPVSEVYCVSSENELILKFIEIIQEVNPDYLCGYNIVGYDLPILFQASDRHKIDLFDELSSFIHWTYDKKSVKDVLSDIQKNTTAQCSSAMENNQLFQLSLNLFPGMLLNDLFRCHKGEKLDELAKSELGMGKEDVCHSEIASYFYDSVNSRSKLLRYNFKDSLLCGALLNTSDNFSSYKFFIAASYNTKIPQSEFFDMKKTPLLTPMFYYAYKRHGMLQDMKIKPKWKNDQIVIRELLMYFIFEDKSVRHPKTYEIIDKFDSGEIKTKTANTQFDFHQKLDSCQRLDLFEAIDVLKRQFEVVKQKNKKHGKTCYTLTHLLLYIRYLNEPVEYSYDISSIIQDYYKVKKLGRYAPVDVSKRVPKRKNIMQKENELTFCLEHFISYLVGRNISSTHTIHQLALDFVKKELKNTRLKDEIAPFGVYLNGGMSDTLQRELRSLLTNLRDGVETRRFRDRSAPETFCEECLGIISKNFLLKFDDIKSQYDGAFVYLPNPGVELEKPVACLDFSSMYPSIGICYNVGQETMLSKATILKNGLQPGDDYETVNIFSRDDYKAVDIKSISNGEASRNFVNFMTPKHAKSILCQVWKDLLTKRMYYKSKIGTFAKEEDNKRVKEISDTYKIIANSLYGLFPNMGHWKISAAVTSVGRQHIQSVAADINKTHRSTTVYGDTDSVMFHFNYSSQELCNMYQSGELHSLGWINEGDNEEINKYSADHYKQGCIITAAISKHIAHKLNQSFVEEPDKAIYKPPSKLEHEKVMLPFAIYQQKHYFARIMDTTVEKESFITKGLEYKKRTVLQATYEVESMMFKDLLHRNPCTWNTYKLCHEIISDLITGKIDLNKISSRKKITVTGYKLESDKKDAGVQLFKRMKARGEIVETGGLEKISLRVVKVENHEDKSRVKYETIEFLQKKQRLGEDLQLNKKEISKQILNEVIKIMKVLHPTQTFAEFQNLRHLKISAQLPSSEMFSNFKRPEEDKKKHLPIIQNRKVTMNDTLLNHFDVAAKLKARKRKGDSLKGQSKQKKLKQTVLQFSSL